MSAPIDYAEFQEVSPHRSSSSEGSAHEREEAFALLSQASNDSDSDIDVGGHLRNNAATETQSHRPATHDDDAPGPQISAELKAMAREHARAEHALTPLQAIRTYRRAIFWCLVASTCVIMEGYDTILIGNFYAYPPFAEKYGQYVDEHGRHQLSAAWQAVLGNSSALGCFFGVLINGHVVDKFGQRRVLLGALVTLSCTVFMTFFAPNIIVLTVGEFLCGFPWGIFASSAPAYASEVLPMCLRVYLTSYTNMCFIIGQLIAAGVLAGLVHRADEWAYRIPFALQWMWPAFLIPVLVFAPESPWHLVRKGKLDEAEKSLRRLRREPTKTNVKNALADIIHTNEVEKQLTPGTSYWDCFRGTEYRRTEIACVAFAGQVLSGSAFAYNSTYFFQQINMSPDLTYNLNTGGTAIALIGTLVNWFALMPNFGRRRIYLYGMFSMSMILSTVGVLNIWTDKSSVAITQAALTLLWTFTFQLSVGQLGWALPAEVGSTRLRQKTICLARNTYYVSSFIANIFQPYFMNPTQWNLKGYTGFIWGSTAFLTFCWAFFRLPETKDRTYEELDWLFEKHTPTRRFETVPVENFKYDEGEEMEMEMDVIHETRAGEGAEESSRLVSNGHGP